MTVRSYFHSFDLITHGSIFVFTISFVIFYIIFDIDCGSPSLFYLIHIVSLFSLIIFSLFPLFSLFSLPGRTKIRIASRIVSSLTVTLT